MKSIFRNLHYRSFITAVLFLTGGNIFRLSAQETPRLVLPLEQKILNSRYSTDGNYVLVADAGTGHTRLYNSSTGKELKTLSGYLLKKAFLSPEKKIEITRSDSAIHFWDMNSDCAEKLCIKLKRTLYSPFIYDLYEDSLIIKSIPDTTGSTYKAAVYEVKSNKIKVELTGHTQPIQSINFSSSGKRVVSTSYDSTARIWMVDGSKNTKVLSGHKGMVVSAVFSPDEKYVLTASNDSTAALYETNSGKRIITFEGHEKAVDFAFFSPNGNFIVTGSDNSTVRIWNVQSGKLMSVIHQKAKSNAKIFVSGNSGMFSPDDKYLIVPFDSIARIWEVKSGKLLKVLNGHSGNVISSCFSPDGKQILTSSEDNSVRIWDTSTGLELKRLGGYTIGVHSVQFSPDNNFILSAFEDSTVRMWDFRTGKPIRKIKIPDDQVFSAELSRDGKIFLVARGNYKARIFETATGKLLRVIKTLKDSNLIKSPRSHFQTEQLQEKFKGYFFKDSTIIDASLSPDGKSLGIIFGGRFDSWIFDIESGSIIHAFKPINWFLDDLSKIKFSPDGKYILLYGLSVYSLHTEKLIFRMDEAGFSNFSADGRYLTHIVHDKVKTYDLSLLDSQKYSVVDTFPYFRFKTVKFWPAGNLALIFREKPFLNRINYIENFYNDNKLVEIWDLSNGKKQELKDGHLRYDNKLDASFSSDGKYILTTAADHQTILWETATGHRLYTRLQLKGDDYLIYDEHYRFDGTPGAMEKLYFVCGLEVIELGQMKDALYVPGLAEKIINGEDINYKKLSELDICAALPVIEKGKENEQGWEFDIQKGRWPILRLEVKVDDKTVRTIPGSSLVFREGKAVLLLKKEEMKPFFIGGKENKLKVLAVANEKGIEYRSRGVELEVKVEGKKESPRLFMLMVGVNDYKDDALDLRFPVQDAQALGQAMENSAKKLLGKESVFVYHVQSRTGGNAVYTTPERAGVMKALEEIGNRSKTSDVLFIFFAGHGVMQGADKSFTFLTADASKVNPVGISTRDLKSWLSPEGPYRMMANKTILVYDACNSGQAAKEMFGDLALSRDDDVTERQRQTEDLADKQGVFILSASAPNQSAYELPHLGQGILTYSLLSTLKHNTGILDEEQNGRGYLNLQKWFLESEREQSRISESMGMKQQAQPYGTANIRIGEVDDEVRNGIKLMAEKPLVFCASARDENEEDLLNLREGLNRWLETGMERGSGSKLAWTRAETSQAYVVKLIYRREQNKVACRILIFKNKVKISEQSVDGTEPELIKNIVAELERLCK